MEHIELVKATAQVVSAWAAHNSATAEDLAAAISGVAKSLRAIGSDTADAVADERLTPAVPVKKSVHPDYIVCLEDGRRLKMLKRHLRSAYGMTPDEYRAKWGLPANYPMVAPNYAAKRSEFAKRIGLGRKRTRTRKAA